MHLTTSLQTFLLALTLLALGLLPLALLAQSDLTPPLLDQSGGDPSTLSSTLAIWSEHLFSLLGPGGPEPPQGQGRLRTFLDDLHLAFVPRRHASHKRKRSHFDSEQLSLQEVTKCKAQLRGLSARHGGLGTRPLPTQSVSGGYGEGGRETIAVIQPCGGIPVGASIDVQTTTGPNGQATWFTCGISLYEKDSGWIPPNATIEQIITLEGGLRAAVKMDGSPYTACNDYIEIFEAAGGEFGIPPLFIAAFALQESSCNPTTIGQGGRTGMMHISADKCANAPNGDCLDVRYNVRTATSDFVDVIKSSGGNIFEAVGRYNDWQRGMSYNKATTWGINGNCCRCQRNLDYLHQFFNGWLQGRSPYSSPRLGTFFNLDECAS